MVRRLSESWIKKQLRSESGTDVDWGDGSSFNHEMDESITGVCSQVTAADQLVQYLGQDRREAAPRCACP